MISSVSSVIEGFSGSDFEPVRCSFLAFVDRKAPDTGECILAFYPGYQLGFA
jgi:hypothetical protein